MYKDIRYYYIIPCDILIEVRIIILKMIIEKYLRNELSITFYTRFRYGMIDNNVI